MMLEWDDLRYFLAIARCGTLSGAARLLNVQQSTMGRRLDSLQERVGAELLQKTPSGYLLTVAGEAILGNAERIENEALAVERLIAGKDVRLEGSVKLTTVIDLAVAVVLPIISTFHEKYPGIALELVADPRLLSLTKREADVALRMTRFTQHDLAARKVSDVAYGVYAAAGYLDRLGIPDFARGAPGHTALLPQEDMMTSEQMTWFHGLTSQASTSLRCNSSPMIAKAAELGLGVACLSRFRGDNLDLVRLDTPSVAPHRELWMGVHNDIRHTPRVRAVTEFLASGLRQYTYRLNPPADQTRQPHQEQASSR
jgi:DNA-binding transcriptional LysR family regulator